MHRPNLFAYGRGEGVGYVRSWLWSRETEIVSLKSLEARSFSLVING